MSTELQELRNEIIAKSRQRRLIWSTIYMGFCVAATALAIWRVLS